MSGAGRCLEREGLRDASANKTMHATTQASDEKWGERGATGGSEKQSQEWSAAAPMGGEGHPCTQRAANCDVTVLPCLNYMSDIQQLRMG